MYLLFFTILGAYVRKILVLDLDNRIEDMQDELDEEEPTTPPNGQPALPPGADSSSPGGKPDADASFMSESIYEKIPSPKSRRRKTFRRTSMPILHEHIAPGSRLNELQAHTDMITALDFDAPFGTMVTAALDDTVRVWDLGVGRCIGMLEGHHASVRCLQVEDTIVATGSADASIRLWDLGKIDYHPHPSRSRRQRRGRARGRDDDDDDDDDENDDDADDEDDDADAHTDVIDGSGADDGSAYPSRSNMHDCALFSLEAHVDEVTALHFQGDVLVSGSADKTLRQWDLGSGRCVQTLDVLWAAAQASTTMMQADSSTGGGSGVQWRPAAAGRLPDATADFVGALQCFDAALACGTADGMVRLWDLRSGQVHRSLVGHTGPITALQFDDVHLVTGSLDRSIRVRGDLSFLQPSLLFHPPSYFPSFKKNMLFILARLNGVSWTNKRLPCMYVADMKLLSP
jgi:division protein 1